MADIIYPGNAIPAHVLSPDKFSAGPNYGAAGTMPNNAPVNPTPMGAAIALGYHDGTEVASSPVGAVLESFPIDAGSAPISVGSQLEFINGKVTLATTKKISKLITGDVRANGNANSQVSLRCCAIDSTRVLVFYQESSSLAYVVVATVSANNTIILGTPLSLGPTFPTSVQGGKIQKLTANTFLTVCSGDSAGTNTGVSVRVITVSGTTCSAGTALTFGTVNQCYVFSTGLINSTTVVMGYQDGGASSYPRAVVLSISGTTVTAGPILVVATTGATNVITLDVLPGSNLVAITYKGASGYQVIQLLSVSGTSVSIVNSPLVLASVVAQDGFLIGLDSTHIAVLMYNNMQWQYYSITGGNTFNLLGSSGVNVAVQLNSYDCMTGYLISPTQFLVGACDSAGHAAVESWTMVGNTPTSNANLTLNAILVGNYGVGVVDLGNGRYFVGWATNAANTSFLSLVTESHVPTAIAAQAGTAGQTISIYRW
jgi:hypothetical protein